MREVVSVALVIAAALGSVPCAEAQSGKGAAFEAGLVRCAEGTQPTPLANCGADRLQEGVAEISDEGEVEVRVVQAAPSVVYSVVYRSLDGERLRVIGELTTNSQGDGYLDAELFTRSQVGSGNVVLKRGGVDQFVTGFKVRK